MFAARKTDGATAAGPATYIEDVFSTYLYTGNGSIQSIPNSIALGDGSSDNVSLHLTGDTLTDSSAVPSTLTIEGNTQVNTSIKKYGTGSIYFDGSGDRIVVPSASKLNLDGDFTVEMWVYITNVSTSYQILFDTSASGTAGASMTELWVQSPGNIGYYARGSIIFTGTTTLAANTWYHVALTKQGSTQRLFVNGVVDATATSTTQPNDSYNWYIGDRVSGAGSAQYPLQGYIDDFRVTKGVARYTGNFTPPAAALPLDTLITGKGGMVWLKGRSGATAHALYDTARGATFDLVSNSTAAQTTETTGLTSFNGNGFSIGALAKLNTSAATYASWTFRKQAKFFDVVTYTGNGSVQNISHNLNAVPGCIIVKRLNSTGNWFVYHRSLGNGTVAQLNTTAASFAANTWNYTTPTSTQFTVSGTGDAGLNGATYVAYLFAHDAGGFGATGTDNVISCGSYTGNASSSGPVVTLGYEPQWVLIKGTTAATQQWFIFDTMRGIVTESAISVGEDPYLLANTSAAETSSGLSWLSVTSTGFQITSGNSNLNGNGENYIYIAIRRGPMKTPTSGTSVFTPSVRASGTGAAFNLTGTGFPPDLLISTERTNVSGLLEKGFHDRLRGNVILRSNTTAAEATDTPGVTAYGQDGFSFGADGSYATVNFSGASYVYWTFRRAPGFFDEVCYTGNGATQTLPHNLGVVPQLMIAKARSVANNWRVYDEFNGPTKRGTLNADTAWDVQSSQWNDTAPTATQFTVGYSNSVSGETHVIYLFATVAGVSKVGSYTGNGSSQTINCGFAAGARFILIKRTDSTGDWYVWDTARGIVAGNDPRLSLNSTAAEVTTDDSIDPDNSGFIVNQLAATNINVSSASYIFLAIS